MVQNQINEGNSGKCDEVHLGKYGSWHHCRYGRLMMVMVLAGKRRGLN